MSDPSGDGRLLFDADFSEPELVSCPGGQAALFSRRSPAKDTPNEDSAALLPLVNAATVLIVADGCGGMAGGEQASRVTVETIERALRAASNGEGPPLWRAAILDGIESANRSVRELGTGAATTLAVVEIQDGMLRPFHVGDSTILLVGNRGKVKLLTRSHSPVGYGVEAGMIPEDEAIHHEDLHIVSNVVGAADMHIEIGSQRPIAARDTLLIASDGVFDNLHVEEVVERIRKGPLLKAAAHLAALASDRMNVQESGDPSKPDDLTFILFRPGAGR